LGVGGQGAKQKTFRGGAWIFSGTTQVTPNVQGILLKWRKAKQDPSPPTGRVSPLLVFKQEHSKSS